MLIKINHIEKIEGHAGFVGHIVNNNVKKARVEVSEGARLIEGLLIGRHYSEVPIITSRICGVCPIVHNLSAIKAIEAAFGIKINKDIELLRRLMLCAEMINSHALHLFFLALADFLDVKDDIDMMKKYPRETEMAVRIRDFGIKLAEIVGGRSIHPINSVVGGFNKQINLDELKNLHLKTKTVLNDVLAITDLITKLKYPRFERATDFVSFTNHKHYASYSGHMMCWRESGKKQISTLQEFNNNIEEIQRQDEVVKQVYHQKTSFFVGALARVNNNHGKLNHQAKKIFLSLAWELPQYNSFYNLIAQAIELVHFIEETDILIKAVANTGESLIVKVDFQPKAGTGIGAVEAPRGTLFHYYEIDANGIIIDSNVITPTAQFLANLDEDLKAYLPSIKKIKLPADRKKYIRKLIRAYDPCVSCATH